MAGTELKNIGSAMTKTVTLPLVAAGTAGAKLAIDFDTAFRGVSKTVDGTDAQMEALRGTILNMSKEMPFAATEIANVMQAAGQMGVQIKDIEQFTSVMLKFGTATDLSATDGETEIKGIIGSGRRSECSLLLLH